MSELSALRVRLCEVDGCEGKHHAKGFCNVHYTRFSRHGSANICKKPLESHGMRHTSTYRSWKAMKTRCLNKNVLDFPHYGGRGIKVCDHWVKSFSAFFADMGERPPKTSLDRIDNNGDYEPGNCRWATNSEQKRNTSRNRLLTIDGKTKPMAAWAEIAGINPGTLYSRLQRGLPVKDAVFGKIKTRN